MRVVPLKYFCKLCVSLIPLLLLAVTSPCYFFVAVNDFAATLRHSSSSEKAEYATAHGDTAGTLLGTKRFARIESIAQLLRIKIIYAGKK